MAAMVDRRISTLNPDAPAFDPVAFREVEDFSPKWWELVRTSKWFRDFWLSVNSEDEFDDGEFSDVEEQFEELIMYSEEAETGRSAAKPLNESDAATLVKALLRVLNLPESPRGKVQKLPAITVKYQNKPTKYVNPKFSCRRNHHIYQPR